MKKMTPQEIYLAVAEYMASNDDPTVQFSCLALDHWGCRHSIDTYHLRCLYAVVMCPRVFPATLLTLIPEDIERAVNAKSNSQVAKDFRVLLLCQMAACYKDVKGVL